MAKSPGGFRAALLIGWIALGAAGLLYARAKGIPDWAALPVLAAFLAEYPFYLVTGFVTLRERFSGARLPVFLLAGAVLPYLICCLGAIPFEWGSLVRLAALALAIGLWFLVLPRKPVFDLAFLAFLGYVELGRYFDGIYPTPYPKVQAKILGNLALIQAAVMSLLVARRIREPGFGFVPNRREWRAGILNYFYFLPVGFALVLALHATHFVTPKPVWYVAATFLGFLWVAGLVVQFYFNGVLRQWLEDAGCSPMLALAVVSVLFGAVHLWFRGFPNWRWAPIAAALCWFCGRACDRAGSIRAGTVTHALVVATWRAFLA
jgi:hypothetical protein